MFYFAWADADTPFGVEHHVYEEVIFSFLIEQAEDGFPTLTVEMINPGAGLLNADRDQWVWFSEDTGSEVKPLFYGRIVGLPENLDRKVVTVVFNARPSDYNTQKETLADAMRVRPYWDPAFVSAEERANPDTVLEGYCAAWHTDRVTGVVTASNRLAGSETVVLGPADVFDGSFNLSYDGRPVETVHVEMQVPWDQFVQGSLDYTQLIINEFALNGFAIGSYTGDGLVGDWPEFGREFGGGWKVFDSGYRVISNSKNAQNFDVPVDPSRATPDFEIQDWWADSPQGYFYWYELAYQKWLVEQMADPIRAARFWRWDVVPSFSAFYSASRARKEVLSFDIVADVQPLVTDDGDPISEDIKITANGLADPIDPGGALPIGQRSNGVFFSSDRGHQSIEYGIALARARILFAARAARMSFDTKYETVVDLSCDKDVLLTHPRVPGGQAGGKIVAYNFGLVGDEGIRTGQITFVAVVGKGNTLGAPSAGDPSYVEVGYVEDYQHYYGQSLQPIAGEVTYDDPEYVPDDDGIDFDTLDPESSLQSVAAFALLTFTGAGSPGDAITVGSRTYSLVSALTDVDQVLIGPDFEATARNLAFAVVRDEEWEGVLFGTGTEAHAQVDAAANDGIVRVTAYDAGPGAPTITVSASTAAASWDSSPLHGGSRGLKVYFSSAAQETALGSQTFASVQEAIDYLKTIFTEIEISLKNVTGGPFETTIPLTVSELMVPKTIDLEAAEP